jgi:hypothetical protein
MFLLAAAGRDENVQTLINFQKKQLGFPNKEWEKLLNRIDTGRASRQRQLKKARRKPSDPNVPKWGS